MITRSVQRGALAMMSIVLLGCQPQNQAPAILKPGGQYWIWWVGNRDNAPTVVKVLDVDQNGWIKMGWHGVEAWVNPDLIAAAAVPLNIKANTGGQP